MEIKCSDFCNLKSLYKMNMIFFPPYCFRGKNMHVLVFIIRSTFITKNNILHSRQKMAAQYKLSLSLSLSLESDIFKGLAESPV